MHGGIDDDEDHKVFSINENRQSVGGRDSERQPLMQLGAAGGDIQIAYVAGTIEVDEGPRLKKLLFRATRGKALTYFKNFDLPR